MKDVETKTKLCLEYSEYTETTREPDPDDSWDQGETRTEFYPEKLRLGEKGSKWLVETFEVDFPVAVDDELFLVVVRYSTGSTFGRSDGQVYFDGVYKTRKEVEAVEKSVEDGTHENHYYWTGYFEYLEGVEIHRLTVEPEYKG